MVKKTAIPISFSFALSEEQIIAERCTNLVFRSLQKVIRILAGMIVNSDRNESKQTKKPTFMSCENLVKFECHH